MSKPITNDWVREQLESLPDEVLFDNDKCDLVMATAAYRKGLEVARSEVVRFRIEAEEHNSERAAIQALGAHTIALRISAKLAELDSEAKPRTERSDQENHAS